MTSRFFGLPDLARNPFVNVLGEVRSVTPQSLTVSNPLGLLEVGHRVFVSDRSAGRRTPPFVTNGPALDMNDTSGRPKTLGLACDIVSLGEKNAVALPLGRTDGIRRGATVHLDRGRNRLCPSPAWLGRVINGLGQPIDDRGALPVETSMPHNIVSPPNAMRREPLGDRLDFGIKALDLFTPSRIGQRLGIFAASGVGKSALMGMLARNLTCDVRIIALIGERGREVGEFIDTHLGPDGLERSVVIVATADEPALLRREAALTAMRLAEHFRDQGQHVLCLIDSLSRIAIAQREIGLASGEPPATRGFTPSVFSLLPAFLERAGPGERKGEGTGQGERGGQAGAITGIYTHLLEGEIRDDPVAEICRASLDGHVVLDRTIAERGRFPAVDILQSLSRTVIDLLGPEERACYTEARRLISIYRDTEDLIRIGAYQKGADPSVDRAIRFWAGLEEILTQDRDSCVRQAHSTEMLTALLETIDH